MATLGAPDAPKEAMVASFGTLLELPFEKLSVPCCSLVW